MPATANAQVSLGALQPARTTQQAMPGEIVVQFDGTAPLAVRDQVRRAARVNVVRTMRRPGLQLVKVADGRSVAGAIRALEADPRVRYAEPNRVYRAAAVPNDPLFGQLWGLSNTGQLVHGVPGTPGFPGADIRAPLAWDRLTGSSGVTIAVVDSGIAYDHPDLDGNIWANPGEVVNGADDDGNGHVDDTFGWDFVDGDADPRDPAGHGTHVAGTIGAEGNNGIGVAGVTWDVQLMPVRVLDLDGTGTLANLADGMDYAGDMGARVVNLSFSGAGASQALSDAIADHPNSLYVAAAGDGGLDVVGDDNELVPQFPCNFAAANLICVAATSQADGLDPRSNFGAASVDLGAPGTNVLSAQPSWAFQDGFESDTIATDWVREGTAQWGRVSTSANTGAFSVTDSPGGNYAPDANAILRTAQAIPMQGQACRIEATMRLDTMPDDLLVIDSSPDAVVWTNLGGVLGGTTTGKYVQILAPLPSSATPLFFRFVFVSNATGEADGVYLDDIRLGCLDTTYDGAEYQFLDGTSMAAAYVSGAAGLILSARPGASVASMKAALMNTGDVTPALVGKTVTGRRLDLTSALGPATAPPVRPPTGPPSGGGPGAPKVTLSISRAQKLRKVLRKGLRVRIRADRPGTARVSARLQRKLARRLIQRRAAGRVRKRIATANRATTVRVRLSRLSRKAKRGLPRLRSAKLTIAVTFTDGAGAKATARRAITLRR